MNPSRLFGLAGLAAILMGCNSQPTGDRLRTVPASGVLIYKGQPLANHQVLLASDQGRPAVGVSDQEGKFTLGTNEKDDGAQVGNYTVVVTYAGPADWDPEKGSPPPPKDRIPAKFTDKQKSTLKLEIPAGGKKDLRIELP